MADQPVSTAPVTPPPATPASTSTVEAPTAVVNAQDSSGIINAVKTELNDLNLRISSLESYIESLPHKAFEGGISFLKVQLSAMRTYATVLEHRITSLKI